MYNPHADETPVNPLPGVVLALAGAIMGIELIFQAGEAGFLGRPDAIGWRLAAARQYGFIDQVFDWMVQNRVFATEHLHRFISYAFVHRSIMHAVMVAVFVLALGKFTAEVLGSWLMLAVFIFASAFGAIAYGIAFDEPGVMLGGYPGVFGLIGAFTWVLFISEQNSGGNPLRAFRLIAIFMAIQLIFKLISGGNNEWFAELTGFAVGFVICTVFGPGGIRRLADVLAQLRER